MEAEFVGELLANRNLKVVVHVLTTNLGGFIQVLLHAFVLLPQSLSGILSLAQLHGSLELACGRFAQLLSHALGLHLQLSSLFLSRLNNLLGGSELHLFGLHSILQPLHVSLVIGALFSLLEEVSKPSKLAKRACEGKNNED